MCREDAVFSLLFLEGVPNIRKFRCGGSNAMAVKIDPEKEALKAENARLKAMLVDFIRFEHVTALVIARLTDEKFVGGGMPDESYSSVVYQGGTIKLVVIPSQEKLVIESVKHPEIRREFTVPGGKTTSEQVDAIIATAARAQRAAQKGGEVITAGAVDLLTNAPATA